MREGLIFFIMGVSGSGKGTLVNRLKNQNYLELEFIRSYVTRQIRSGEVNGDIYNFISMEEFKNSIDNGEFLEYKFVHNLNYYGTKRKEIIEYGIEKGKILFKEVDMEGLKDIYKNYPYLKKYIKTIFLDISEETYRHRIFERQGFVDEIELENRVVSLNREKADSKVFCDFIIDAENNNKEQVFEQVIKIIKENIV